ncbi:MAG: dTDP-glucose 4,6-dehydratase [Acidimicrobiales bacterium]
MRVVITGAAGFIGSRFTELLLADAERLGYDELVLLDALTYSGRRENLDGVLDDPRVRFVHGSILDATIDDEVLRGARALVHFAAESHVDRSLTGAEAFFATNVLGTQTLLEAARRAGVERVVHVSTDEVYGSIAEGAWREDHLLEPNSPYSASKAGSDLAALAYHRTYGLAVSVTRCSNNYGPRQFPEKVIPLFVTNLIDGRRVPLYGDGLNVRDWLHVDDHCRGVALVLERGRAGEIYNIGGGTELTNHELTRRLLALLGRDESMIEPVADRLGHDRRYCVDWTKIHEELGYAPRVDFDEGLAATVRWYREHESWWRPLTAART